MKRLRDTEFYRSLPESIPEILLQVFIFGGALLALMVSSFAGSWWAFPIVWVAVMVVYFLIDRWLTRRHH